VSVTAGVLFVAARNSSPVTARNYFPDFTDRLFLLPAPQDNKLQYHEANGTVASLRSVYDSVKFR
jgi:hypothetical protein